MPVTKVYSAFSLKLIPEQSAFWSWSVASPCVIIKSNFKITFHSHELSLVLFVFLQSYFPVSFPLFFFGLWVGEQSQWWYGETLALTQCWYAVTTAEAGRGRSWAQREARGWLIETRVRTSDQTLTPEPHVKQPRLPWPVYILCTSASLCFHFVSSAKWSSVCLWEILYIVMIQCLKAMWWETFFFAVTSCNWSK